MTDEPRTLLQMYTRRASQAGPTTNNASSDMCSPHSHASQLQLVRDLRRYILEADGRTLTTSQLQLVGDLRRDVLEADRRPGDPLEPHPVQRQPRQLADLHLPLDEAVGVGVAVHAQQQEAVALLVVAVVGVEDLAYLSHHLVRVHRARRLHAPGEAQRSRLHLVAATDHATTPAWRTTTARAHLAPATPADDRLSLVHRPAEQFAVN